MKFISDTLYLLDSIEVLNELCWSLNARLVPFVDIVGLLVQNYPQSLLVGGHQMIFPSVTGAINSPTNFWYLFNELIPTDTSPSKSSGNLINLLPAFETNTGLEALENIRTNYVATSPNVKLYYPEPFVASASFMHNDIGFLHILQYQFWLWFLFIFLIVFFFISFLCVLRWCTNRVQPRRETRGVSRSKCGDLITATVPVTWAISIIVSESTDATDYYDGFGTGELIIGVRAYQWGWHYYYPKHADLNYNVKPSYSTFLGNSLKYNTTPSDKLTRNSLWRFYQTKLDDAPIMPAHFLILPTDNSNIFNFLSFRDIGLDTLQASTAFKQVRASSRFYTTHLVHNPSVSTSKYIRLNNLYFTNLSLINTNNFNLKRQHTLTSSAATTALHSTFLDVNSLKKFLNHTFSYNNTRFKKTGLFNQPLDFWSKEGSSQASTLGLRGLDLLMRGSGKFNTQSLKVLSTYPSLIKEFGDNSDKTPTHFPLRKLLKRQFAASNRGRLSNHTFLMNSINSTDASSVVAPFFKTSLQNYVTTSKEFMVNYPFQAIPSGNQTIRKHKNLTENRSNYNLSLGLSSLDANLTKVSLNNSTFTPSYIFSLQKANWSDSTIFNKLASNRYHYLNTSPLLSNNPKLGSFSYDRSLTQLESRSFSGLQEVIKVQPVYNKTIQLLSGDRSGEDKTPTTPYWKAVWAYTNGTVRLNNLFQSFNLGRSLALPTYVDYYDYDFRNAQAFKLLEDVAWDATYSSYNHLDYLNIYNKYRETYDATSQKWLVLNKLFLNADRDSDRGFKFPTNAKTKARENVGAFYPNSVQLDDYFTPFKFWTRSNLSELPLAGDLVLFDDSYMDHKNINTLYPIASSLALGIFSTYSTPQSHHAILNNFRSDFEDFGYFTDTQLKLPLLWLRTPSLYEGDFTNKPLLSLHVGAGSVTNFRSHQINSSRFSNPIALRRSAKSSLVTYQAYQKVFKLRYEEGRAHVRLLDFADSKGAQPYTTEQKIKYEKMLGKTRLQFYNTSATLSNLLPTFNSASNLFNSLNSYFFEFPFIEGVTNDPTRHIWFDAYSKYAQREVSGSSVSKFTIVGVPFSKKKYDFNVKQGRQLVDAELYFNRIATARKSYLPQWIYTPYLFSRSNLWFTDTRFSMFHTKQIYHLINVKLNLKRMEWYWLTPAFSLNTSAWFTPSFSNSSKSSFQPLNSIQGYYFALNTLTDLLSKRENLYRQLLERRNNVLELPLFMRATPKHPLISEIKSSFLLVDPITYNSEYSRELVYNSTHYFKFLLFHDILHTWNRSLDKTPLNFKLLTQYLFFHFIDQTPTDALGNRSELVKSQYKPLKKGISNMMRLQGTGAVAMPIEIRLQILASSKDVIHSWAIPSAGIKIDCIPGYTSHRITIFYTPGIYWGQCMEICGRYHHWMPIILYFMKRDLFFLWCTHFLSKKDPYATKFWEANDRQFADYVSFVSYDKSTWLTELYKEL